VSEQGNLGNLVKKMTDEKPLYNGVYCPTRLTDKFKTVLGSEPNVTRDNRLLREKLQEVKRCNDFLRKIDCTYEKALYSDLKPIVLIECWERVKGEKFPISVERIRQLRRVKTLKINNEKRKQESFEAKERIKKIKRPIHVKGSYERPKIKDGEK
jgi:hypothetical protein